jgi:hypothetical protein
MAVSEPRRIDVEIEDVGLIGWLIYDAFGPTVKVEGVDIPTEFYLRFPGDSTSPSLHVNYAVRGERPMCTGMRMDAKPQGREIFPYDMDVIRQMLSEWTQGSVIAVIQNENEVTEDEARAAYTAISRKPKRRTITERLLTDVARLYRDNIDGKPWSVIARHYNVSEATAGRYVVLARKAGHLPPTESGKKKA